MDMLLRNIGMGELARLFARNRDRSPAPYLADPKVIARARRLAKKNGIWDGLDSLDPNRDIPAFRRSAYRNYRRVGLRSHPLLRSGERAREMSRAALALWLGHPKADVDYVQDLLWATCDDWTWVANAHEGLAIDLSAVAVASRCAEIVHVLGDRLEDEVKQRVGGEIDRRIFRNFWDYEEADWWKTCHHNWNHVCNGQIIRTALYQIEDPRILAHMIHAAIQNMTYALDGFGDDGGCEEGPGYWSYGFGNYCQVAHALYLKTGGDLNIMDDPKIERICRYPVAAQIAGPLCSTFADSSHGHIPVLTALQINVFHNMPEVYELCPQNPDGALRVRGMHELALYRGQKAKGAPDLRDYILPDLGQVKLRGKPGKKQMTVMAIAGHNGVNHNHNDIGSFIVHRGDRLHLVDPGGPVYTQKTFSPQRYEIIYCNSLGHSVPVINGQLQQPGRQYYGTLSAENLNGEGEKRAVIDMTHAYPKGTVKQLVRTFTLDVDANRLALEDAYTFSRKPKSIEEAFITFQKAIVASDGQSVQIGAKAKGVILSAVDTPGTFSAARLVAASKEGRTGDVITRITFAPETLEKDMGVRFEIA